MYQQEESYQSELTKSMVQVQAFLFFFRVSGCLPITKKQREKYQMQKINNIIKWALGDRSSLE